MKYKLIILFSLINIINFDFAGHWPIYQDDGAAVCTCARCLRTQYLLRKMKKRRKQEQESKEERGKETK